MSGKAGSNSKPKRKGFSKSKPPKKADYQSGKTKRSTKADILKMETRIKELHFSLQNQAEITRIIMEEFFKGRTQVIKRISKVMKDLESESKIEVNKTREQVKGLVLQRIGKCLKLFEKDDDPKYERLAQRWLEKYTSLFKNNLEPESEVKDQVINISFNRLPKVKK